MLRLIYLFVPAYIANMMPVFGARIWPRWNAPLDLGMRCRGKRVFGAHKTWRGLVSGVLAAVVTAYVQYVVTPQSWVLIDYPSLWLAWGLLMGFGALGGDAIKSFFKRQRGMVPGRGWVLFDQADYIVGAVALGAVVYFPGWAEATSVIVTGIALHFAATIAGYLLGLKKTAW